MSGRISLDRAIFLLEQRATQPGANGRPVRGVPYELSVEDLEEVFMILRDEAAAE